MPPRKERAPPKEIDESQLIPGAIILFHLKGYPPWPAVVLTDEHIPSQVRNVKPQSKAYPIRFFPLVKPDAWASPKSGDIHAILTKEEIDAFVENPKKGTSKPCLQAYQAAAQPLNLDGLKISEGEDEDVEMEEGSADQEEGEDEEEDDAALEDIKDLYEDEDDEGTGRKRKRKVTDDGAQKSKKKKSSLVEQPKKRRKGKAEQNGTTTEPKERKKPGRKPKNKQAEEEAAAAKKKAEYRKKEIMYIRHRIQKALLDKSGKEPEEDELPLIVENLKKLADFNWITPAFISETKIHKVLKRVIALPTIPHDENHDIKSRAAVILKQWTPHLDEIAKTEKKEGPSTAEEGSKKASSASEAEKDIAAASGESMESGEKAEPTKTDEASKVKSAKETAADEFASVEPMAIDEKPSDEGKGEKPAVPEEDFVMVDSGGQVDELSQEKAAQKFRDEEPPKSEETEMKEGAEIGTGAAVNGADGTAAPAASGSSIVHGD